MNKLSSFKEMDKGKKVKLIATVLLMIIVIYMLPGLFSSSTPPINTVQNNNRNAMVINQPPVTTVVAPEKNVLLQKTLKAEDSPLLKEAKDSQRKYLEASNELKMLQLQQKIAETKRAITASQLEVLRSQQDMKNLTAPPPPATLPFYGQSLATTTSLKPEMPYAHTADSSEYSLLYIANEGGAWQAIVGSNGKFYSVTPNSVLPDGSKVTAINGTTVELEKDANKRTISITPII